MSNAEKEIVESSAERISRLSQLKQEFYEWCGLLSINEIVSNTNLIRVIERLERMLLATGA